MSPDKLVMMANQIGKFFVTQGREKAPAGIADHLRKFWDPRMRANLIAHWRDGGKGLDPEVYAAVALLAADRPASERLVSQPAETKGSGANLWERLTRRRPA